MSLKRPTMAGLNCIHTACKAKLKQHQWPKATANYSTLQSTSAMVSLTFPRAIVTAENTRSSTEASHLYNSNKSVIKTPQTGSFSAARCPYWNIFSPNRIAHQCYRQMRAGYTTGLKNHTAPRAALLQSAPLTLQGKRSCSKPEAI